MTHCSTYSWWFFALSEKPSFQFWRWFSVFYGQLSSKTGFSINLIKTAVHRAQNIRLCGRHQNSRNCGMLKKHGKQPVLWLQWKHAVFICMLIMQSGWFHHVVHLKADTFWFVENLTGSPESRTIIIACFHTGASWFQTGSPESDADNESIRTTKSTSWWKFAFRWFAESGWLLFRCI